jgi:hypothetical protein
MSNFRPARSSQQSWSRPLADLIGTAIDPVLARQGFSQSDILLYWDEIVGPRLAAASEPLSLRWPPRGRGGQDRGFAPATLTIRVESGFALELQHSVALVIERINTHLGFACVGKIALKQGPVGRRTKALPRRQPPSAAALRAAESYVGDISEEPLRTALVRLGARVMTKE